MFKYIAFRDDPDLTIIVPRKRLKIFIRDVVDQGKVELYVDMIENENHIYKLKGDQAAVLHDVLLGIIAKGAVKKHVEHDVLRLYDWPEVKL